MDKQTRYRSRSWPLKRPGHWVSLRKSSRLRVIRGCKTFECWYTPRVGWFCSRVSVRESDSLTTLVTLPMPSHRVKKISFEAKTEEGGPVHLAPLDCRTFSPFPHLVTHCCVMRYDDGDARRPGWFTVKSQGASWVVQVKDPNGCCQLQCIGNTLDDALALADMLLGSEMAPWEPDPFLKQMAAKGRK